ncbi:hypothetical protein OTU49_014564, partial [Cherax quadricarinatus]
GEVIETFASPDPERFPHAAPEVADGQPCTPPADVYAMGKMYLDIRTKCDEVPQELETLAEQARQSDPLKRPSLLEIIAQIQNIIKCLKPSKREVPDQTKAKFWTEVPGQTKTKFRTEVHGQKKTKKTHSAVSNDIKPVSMVAEARRSAAEKSRARARAWKRAGGS